MPWIRTVPEEEAKGMTKRYFEASKNRRGFVSSTTKIMSIRENHLRANQSMFVSLMEGESGLSRTEKEMIAVRVSALNKCNYWRTSHGQVLVKVSGDVNLPVWVEEGRLEKLAPKMQAVLAYVEKLNLRMHQVTEADLAPLREAGLSDEDILDVVMITGYFNHMNRMVSALGVELTDEQRERQAEIESERENA